MLGSQDEVWSTAATAAPTVKLPHISYERPHFSQDSRYLSTQEAKDLYIIRDRESGEICHRLPGGFFPIHLGPGGREIIGFSAASSRLTWWDAVDGKETKSYPCAGLADIVHPHLLLRVTPDGQSWLALDAPTRIGLHRSSDGTLIRSWTVPEMHGQIERDGHLAVSQDGALAAWRPTGSSTIWLLRATGPPQPLVGHRMDLTRLEFSPDGQTLASSSVDHTIRLWTTASGVCQTVLPGHFEEVSDISFSPDGRSLASVALGDSVKFWQLPLGRELMRLEDADLGRHIVFSPDGHTLAVTGDYARPYGPDRSLKLLRAP